MGFGRNPHVAKAEAAEQKAHDAKDAGSYERNWRDAANQWERASERETDGKRKASYLEKAESARANADGPPGGGPSTDADADEADAARGDVN